MSPIRGFSWRGARTETGQYLDAASAIVTENDTVLVWDPVAKHYTSCHSLTELQQETIKKHAKAL